MRLCFAGEPSFSGLKDAVIEELASISVGAIGTIAIIISVIPDDLAGSGRCSPNEWLHEAETVKEPLLPFLVRSSGAWTNISLLSLTK